MITDKMRDKLDALKQYKENVSISWYTLFSYEEHKDAKQLLKDALQLWLAEKDVTAFIRFENHYSKGFSLNAVCFYNNVGGLEKKSTWLNKVVVMRDFVWDYDLRQHRMDKKWIIRTHKARTDPKFLSPFDEECCQIMEEIQAYLEAK